MRNKVIDSETLRKQEKINRKYYQIYRLIKNSFTDGEVISVEDIRKKCLLQYPSIKDDYEFYELMDKAIRSLKDEGIIDDLCGFKSKGLYKIQLPERSQAREIPSREEK